MSAGPAGGHTFAALRTRNFRLYWIGQLVSLTGTWMQTLALAAGRFSENRLPRLDIRRAPPVAGSPRHVGGLLQEAT